MDIMTPLYFAYVAIRADEPEDSPARLLRDWILSDEGKAAIIKAGYIPV